MSKIKKIRSGDILIAEPFLADPNFSRAVVYIVEHNAEGTVGFVVNQPMGLLLKDVIHTQPAEEFDIPLYSGGPVGTNTLHVVHQLGDHVKHSKYIARHTYWGGDFDQIKFLLLNKNADWRDVKIFIGYSGWSPDQLDAEVASKSWIIHRGSEDLIFNKLEKATWEQALRDKGGKYKLFQKSPLKPDWN